MSSKASVSGHSPHNCDQVIEVPRIIRQERIHHRQVEQIVEVPVPEIVEEIVEVPALIHKARALQRNVDQLVEIAVPEVVEETVEVPKIVTRERIRQRSVEKFTDIPVPQVVEERVEMPVIVPQIRICHRMVEHFVDVPVPQMVEEVTNLPRSTSPFERSATQSHASDNLAQEDVVEVPKIVVLERVKQRSVEHFVEVPVPQIVEEVVEEVDCPVVLHSVIRNTVPWFIDVPVPEIVEELVEVVKQVVREDVTVESVDHVVDVPVPQIVEEIIEVPVPQTVERVQQRKVEVPTGARMEDEGFPWLRDEVAKVEKPKVTLKTVQRKRPSPPRRTPTAASSPEKTSRQTVDVPQIQWVDKVIDVPVIKQVEVPCIKKVQKHVEVPQIKWVDQKMDVPRIKKVPVPSVQTVQTKKEVLQVEWIDKIIDVPVVKQRPVPVIQKVKSIVEVPRVEFVDEVVDTPVSKKRLVPMLQRVHKTLEVEPEASRGRSPPRTSKVPLIADMQHTVMDVQSEPCSPDGSPSRRSISSSAARVRKIVEVPCIQWTEKVVDVPVLKQRHVPMEQKVKKIITKPVIEWQNEVVDCPELKLQQVPSVQVLQKTVEVPKITQVNRVVEAPAIKVREVPIVRNVQKVVEVPQIEFVDKFVDVPVLLELEKSSLQAGTMSPERASSPSSPQCIHRLPATPTRQCSTPTRRPAGSRNPPAGSRTPVSPLRSPAASPKAALRSPAASPAASGRAGTPPIRSPARTTPPRQCRDMVAIGPSRSPPAAGFRSGTPQRVVTSLPQERSFSPQPEYREVAGFTTMAMQPDTPGFLNCAYQPEVAPTAGLQKEVAGFTTVSRYEDVAGTTTVSREELKRQQCVTPFTPSSFTVQRGVVVPRHPEPSEEVDLKGSIEAPSLADSMASGCWPPGAPDAPRTMRLADGWLGGSSMQDVLSSRLREESEADALEECDGKTREWPSESDDVEGAAADKDRHPAEKAWWHEMNRADEAGLHSTEATTDDDIYSGRLLTTYTTDFLLGSNRHPPWESESVKSPPSSENTPLPSYETAAPTRAWVFKGAFAEERRPSIQSSHGGPYWQFNSEGNSTPIEASSQSPTPVEAAAHSAVASARENDMFSARLLTSYITDLAMVQGAPWELEDTADIQSSNPQDSTQMPEHQQRLHVAAGPCIMKDGRGEDRAISKGFGVGVRVRAQFKDPMANRITNTRYPGCIVGRNMDATYCVKYDDGSYWNNVPENCMELEVQWV